jgi:hypothetical protein
MWRSKAQLYFSFAIVFEAALLLSGCATSTPKVASVAGEVPETKIVSEPKIAADATIWKTGQTFSRLNWKRFPEPQQSEIVGVLPLFGTYYQTPRYGYAPDGIPICPASRLAQNCLSTISAGLRMPGRFARRNRREANLRPTPSRELR